MFFWCFDFIQTELLSGRRWWGVCFSFLCCSTGWLVKNLNKNGQRLAVDYPFFPSLIIILFVYFSFSFLFLNIIFPLFGLLPKDGPIRVWPGSSQTDPNGFGLNAKWPNRPGRTHYTHYSPMNWHILKYGFQPSYCSEENREHWDHHFFDKQHGEKSTN